MKTFNLRLDDKSAYQLEEIVSFLRDSLSVPVSQNSVVLIAIGYYYDLLMSQLSEGGENV